MGIQGDGNVPLHEWVERDADAVDEDFAREPQEDDAVAVAEKQLKAMLSGRPANGPPEQSASAASLAKASAEGTVDQPVTWVFEPESFAPLAKIVGGERFGIVTDHLGTPRAMFDGNGREVWGADVDAYGDLRNLRGERAACPFRWPGQYEDEETGLSYNRWRYYDALASEYVSRDRLGVSGGLQPHCYVHDPLTWTDAKGLTAQCSPTIHADELRDKTRSEIGALASQKGLIPVGTPDAATGLTRKWTDPVSGKERLRLDRGHIDKSTGKPYDDARAAVDHVHGYTPSGQKIGDPLAAGNPHFPTTGE